MFLDLFPLVVDIICLVILIYPGIVTGFAIELLIQTQIDSASGTPSSTNWSNFSIFHINVRIEVHTALFTIIHLRTDHPLLTDRTILLATNILKSHLPF